MSEPTYRPAGRPASLREGRRRAGSRSPQQAVKAAQALAGNAAVSEAIEPEDAPPAVSPATSSLPGLRLRRPAFDISLSPRAFDPLLEGRKPRSARHLAGAMAGKRGRIMTDWVAATRAAAPRQPAEVRVGRRRATVRGRLEDLAALEWEQGELSSTAAPREVDLGSIAPSAGSTLGHLRVQVGRLDLIDARSDVEVALDGRGTIRLTYDLPRGTLTLVGHERGRSSGGLDWEYTLELPTMPLARAVWSLRPPEHGGLKRASAEAPEDDDGDDEPPRRDDPQRRGSGQR